MNIEFPYYALWRCIITIKILIAKGILSNGNWGRTKVKYRQLRRELKKETVFRP